MQRTKKWFADNVENPLKERGISLQLVTVKVNNTLKKPGPVFNAMARVAYNNGANYFFRINDDTEMLTVWPQAFVKGNNLYFCLICFNN